MKNDTVASWNGEIFREQVRGQRYRIDTVQGGRYGKKIAEGGYPVEVLVGVNARISIIVLSAAGCAYWV